MHEVIRTANLLNDAFHRCILQHRAVSSDPVLLPAADAVAELLASFYQKAGARFSSDFE